MNTTTLSARLRVLVATVTVGAFIASFATVCAAADNDPVRITVKYGDLNLSTPQGATTLYKRLVAASREACASYDISSGRFESFGAAASCVSKALGDAVTKVGHPELFAIYNANHQQPLPITVASNQNR